MTPPTATTTSVQPVSSAGLRRARQQWSALVLAGFCVLALGSGDRSSAARDGEDPSKPDGQVGAKEPAAAPMAVTAEQLFDDYHDNEVAADDKYKKRRLRVTGTLASIDKDFLDNIVLRLRTKNQFQSAMATMKPAEKATAAALKKGQAVTVDCVGGGMVVGSPSLRDCTFAP